MTPLLDRTIVLSFDRTGFERHKRSFAAEAARDLSGTRGIVTGGTDGIGLAVSLALSAAGVDVEMWSRSRDKGLKAEALRAGRFVEVDLGDLDQVARAAQKIEGPLSCIVLNAGAMPLTRTRTPQGHELMWASQLLGHLLLLRILHARGLLTADARVVWVSSGGMYLAKLQLEEPPAYQRHRAYANVKRAQVELSAHLAERWPGVPMAAMHPGWVATEAVKHSMPWFYRLTRPLLRSPDQGADTITWLLTRKAPVPNGKFWFDRAEAQVHRSARTHTPPATREAFVERVFSATQPFLENADA